MTSKNYNENIKNIAGNTLSHYLKVYNLNTMREMGYVGNISCNGLMLVSSIPVLVGAVYNMCIILPGEGATEIKMEFDARCHWCKPDVGPEYFDSGYSILNADMGIINLVDQLKLYFSFSNTHKLD